MNELTAAEIAARIEALQNDVAEIARQHRESMTVIQTLLARITDSSHVSKVEAALILSRRWHHRVTTRTVQRMIERGILTLERIPGTRQTGIPVVDVERAERSYVPTRALRAARERHGTKTS